MRIGLTTTFYPPEGNGGIPRQRQILAQALFRQGHEVHVFVQGKAPGWIVRDGINIHTIPGRNPPLSYSEKYPSINTFLTHSQGIQEKVRLLGQVSPLDILDVPLWGLEGLIPIYANDMPVVLWLQTSRAHLVALDKRPPNRDEIGIIALEKESLQRAQGIIADSHTVLPDFEKIFDLQGLKERSRAIPLGIPDLPEADRIRRSDENWIEILLVGRLEKRKGTPFLFKLLPDMLKREKRLRVRFIGADNSRWDGFQAETRLTYPEYFHKRSPGLHDRVTFEGPVSEERLVEAYNQADIMLVPSLYESFGLTYLEAMRAGLPVITFSAGAAPEIFPHGQGSGAVLIPLQHASALCEAVLGLASDPERRIDLGKHGRQRFMEHYLDTRMAEETAAYYQEIRAGWAGCKPARPRRIFQVMEGLDVGDAVSGIALRNARLLQEMGAGGTILGRHAHPQLANHVRPIEQFDSAAHAALIYHYWNYSYVEDFIRGFRGPKAIHFHNITPPEYFPPGSPGHLATSRGYEQLPKIINLFDLLIGDSAFNLETCRPYLDGPKPGIVIPPVVEPDEIRRRPYDTRLLNTLRRQEGTRLLFVGRIARNKRQDRLIELFDAYCRSFDPHAWLYLVGSDQGDPAYRAELEALRSQSPFGERILITGKVGEEALASYYRAAEVFISASEHEGFCLPLLEAMALDIPVLAYAAAAVPETMGEAGLLVREWEPNTVAKMAYNTLPKGGRREELLAGQRNNLLHYTADLASQRINAAVRFLQSRQGDDALMVLVNPNAVKKPNH
jgi:glycosyltransferase involved in cell wall biosynthesis